MAARTLSRVAGRTLVAPIDTRETVWAETPARTATSNIEGFDLDRVRFPEASPPEASPSSMKTLSFAVAVHRILEDTTARALLGAHTCRDPVRPP
ncbi:hypothetical protein GALLR39Z86_38150 [Glycomyces algeriensis]|uniref:Uncharacterized protein n=1 Tax=Glycomyces algeriensis TaxID=256037 RepID=A0A9W6LI46_9ACTN|nr:hypothetical protein GALLR39Z86_38150 [Glycomyces algeriensis]